MNSVYNSLSPTVFDVMSTLARAHAAINLGQGFPDDPGPLVVREKAAEYSIEGPHQYAPSAGLPELRQAISAFYQEQQGLLYDWSDEVTVTTGASEALAASIFALLNTGDEVIVFEPAYDLYTPLIERAGGRPRFLTLRPPDWSFTASDLEKLFSSRTRLLILNNPMNPAAVMFSQDSLSLIAELCVRHNVIALCDEVWEHITFDGRKHTPLAVLPGMRERTVKIGSAGKLLSLTGWKVGFMLASPPLTSILRKAHQFFSFSVPPNLQRAVAWALQNSSDWFRELPHSMERSRNRLTTNLTGLNFDVLGSHATYFVNLDLAASGIREDDKTFCLRAVTHHGIAAIPLSAFFSQGEVNHLVRLCAAKPDALLDKAARCLAEARDATPL